MAGDWKEVTLDEISEEITVGHVGLMADQYIEDGVPFLRSLNVEPFRINLKEVKYISREFHKKLRKSALRPGDVVIVRTGKPGACAVIPDWIVEANCSDLVIVRTSRCVRPKYISYVVNSTAGHHISAYTVGAVQQHFNVGSARTIRFMLPTLVEQDRILHLLSGLDDKIDLNRRMAETLEGIARAIFTDWFVDFGPVHSKAGGRPTGLPDHLAALFPDRFVGDGLPAGWVIGMVADLADLNPESWSKSNYPSVIQYVDLSNTKLGTIKSAARYSRDSAPSRAQRILRRGDTIIGTVRPGNGSYALVDEDGKTGSTGFAVLRPKRPNFREIVYLAATSPDNIERLAHLADGGAYPAVRPDVVSQTRIPGIKPDIIGTFSSILAPLLDRAESSKRESRTLADLRDTLISKLISGELRIADAQQRIAAA